MADETLRCDTCGRDVAYDEARRTGTFGGLDPTKWQTVCRPDCGTCLQTMFVGDE